MALDESIPYLYDSTVSANGILWGSTLPYIISAGGQDTAEPYTGLYSLDRCCFVKPGTMAPMYQQCLVKESTQPQMTIGGVFTPRTTNLGYFLCDGSWGNAYADPSVEVINNGALYDIASGTSQRYYRQLTSIPTARVAVGNLDMSKYCILPVIRACAHGNPNSYVSVDFATYKNQYSASHPDIIGIEYSIRYKADLNSASTGSGTNYRLWGTTDNVSGVFYQRSTAIGNNINKFVNKWSGTRVRPITALYAPPNLRYYKVQVPFSSPAVYLPSVCCDIGLSSTHSPNVQKLALDNIDYQQATLAYMYIDYTTAVSIMDSIGMWWAESLAAIGEMHGSLTTSDEVHMPLIDENGTPFGSITGGGVTDIQDSPIYQQWGDQNLRFPVGEQDALGAVVIDPTRPPSPNVTNTQTTINIYTRDPDLMPDAPKLNGLGVFSNYYALAKTGVDSLNDFLWNSDETVINDILNSLKLFGQSPIDAIISLRLYPFNIVSLLPSVTPEEIVLGRVATGVSGLKIPSDASTSIDLGSIYLPRKYNNFLDYAPYSSYSLYIPFCGVVNLNPNIFLDHYVSVRMVIDITTGKCTAIIYVGSEGDYGIPIQYVDGMIGVEIPVTAENMGKLGAAVLEAVGNTAAAAVSTGVAGAAFAAVGGAIDVMFTDIAPQKTGNISASGSLSMPIKLYLAVSSPTIVLPDNYGHTHGYCCDLMSTVKSQTGYIVCYNVDTSSISGATESEREQIKTLLETGVFI